MFVVLRNVFLYSCVLLMCTALFPVLWHLWINAGSANANFYFAITLVFNIAQVKYTFQFFVGGLYTVVLSLLKGTKKKNTPVTPSDAAGVGLFLRFLEAGAPPGPRTLPKEERWLRGHAGAQIKPANVGGWRRNDVRM